VPRWIATVPQARVRNVTPSQPAARILSATSWRAGHWRIDSARYTYAAGFEETRRASAGITRDVARE
jgi:hypothetical protein